MNNKPKIFIGSSVESLDIADAVNLNLDHSAEVSLWRNNTFDLSSNSIDSLVKKTKSVDFSLFIFSPDDIAIVREQERKVVRDNVLFELGLFIGALGKERCFILKPRGVDLHFPTDLLGVTPADYEPNRSDGDLASAVNHACVLMKQQMEKLGNVGGTATSPPAPKMTIEAAAMKELDYLVLGQLLGTSTETVEGYDIWEIKRKLDHHSRKVDLSVIRLERLGYVEKRSCTDQNDHGYYSYNIVTDGVECVLANEEMAFPTPQQPP